MQRISFIENHILSVLFLFASLSACGDGVGSRVVTTSVSNGETAVSTDESFEITFLYPVDTSTVTEESAFLVESSDADSDLNNTLGLLLPLSAVCDFSQAISSTITCPNRTSCTLVPDDPLNKNSTYTLCLTTSISYSNPTAFGDFPGTSISFSTAALESIELSPAEPTLTEINETQEFTVTGSFDDGSTETLTTGLTWTSSNTSVASITDDGVATALATGESTITVTHESLEDAASTTLTVALDSEGEDDTPATYTVGGTISGLSGTLVLQNNAGDNKTVSSSGSFTFSTSVTDGGAYAVTILTQPAIQTCTVSSGSGTVSGANITNITITCDTNTYTVGGTVSGLSGTLVLQNNGGDSKTLSSNGAFTFTSAIDDSTTYSVTVLTQPSGQTCTLTSASGTISSANITSVSVSCSNNSKKLFVTSTTSTGNLGGITGADAICMADANYPGSGTYKALLVDGSTRVACTTANCGGGTGEHTNWVLASSTAYVRAADDTPVFTSDSNGIFVFGTFTNAFTASSVQIWTGLDSNWTTYSQTCTGYTVSMSAGARGTANATDATAISGATSCMTPNLRLVCVEQ